MFFYNIIEEENAFLGYKNKKFKKSKNWGFPKALTYGFGPKENFFQLLFLANIEKENLFYDILERKNAFVGCKSKKLKKSKNWHFSKGKSSLKKKKLEKLLFSDPWFWSENSNFSNFFYFKLLSRYKHKSPK